MGSVVEPELETSGQRQYVGSRPVSVRDYRDYSAGLKLAQPFRLAKVTVNNGYSIAVRLKLFVGERYGLVQSGMG